MQPQREDILQQALALPAEDRAFVVAALAKSLSPRDAGLPLDEVDEGSPTATSGAAFLQELERRSAAFRDGSTSARPGADVLADLRRRQAGEAPAQSSRAPNYWLGRRP